MTEIEDRGVVDHEDSDLDLDEEEEDEEGQRNELEQPMWVVPLYSMLPPEKQQMVGGLTQVLFGFWADLGLVRS